MSRYKRAGVDHVYVGVERTDQATLDMFKKNTPVSMGKRAIELISGHDMISETSMVLGLPTDTPETMEIDQLMSQGIHGRPGIHAQGSGCDVQEVAVATAG